MLQYKSLMLQYKSLMLRIFKQRTHVEFWGPKTSNKTRKKQDIKQANKQEPTLKKFFDLKKNYLCLLVSLFV